MQQSNQLKRNNLQSNIQKSILQVRRFNKKDSKKQEENITRQYKDYLSKQEDLSREFTRQLQDEFISYLEDNYILFNKEDIIDFIFNEHPNLQGFLCDVTPIVKNDYSSNQLMLMYNVDYDSPELTCITLIILYPNEEYDYLKLKDDLLNFKIKLNKFIEFHNIDWEFDMGVAPDDCI